MGWQGIGHQQGRQTLAKIQTEKDVEVGGVVPPFRPESARAGEDGFQRSRRGVVERHEHRRPLGDDVRTRKDSEETRTRKDLEGATSPSAANS